MNRVVSTNFFDLLADQPFTSEGIRPGGLELTRRAVVLSGLNPGDAVLDIGCGTGVTVDYLIGSHSMNAVGIDYSSTLLERGRALNPGIALLRGNAEALPFADGSFDAVFLECVLSLVRNREQVLKECRRVLRPSGKVVVTDVYARNPEAIDTLRSLPVRSCLRGALEKDRLFLECIEAGLGFLCVEDHSELLKDFAVKTIWSHGSLDGLLGDAARFRSAVRAARPGYFLLIGSAAWELHAVV